MTVTIIVPFYDETAFLRSALRSIRSQPQVDAQIIVVNDNPERFSAAEVEDLCAGFDVTILHHASNQGLSAARNTGMAQATGTLIGFLDSDDYYTDGGLAQQVRYANETGADVTHACCLLGLEGQQRHSVLHRDALLHTEQRVLDGPLTAEEAQFIVSSWSSLYRADFLRENGLQFDTEQRKFEDRLFVLQAVTAAKRVAFLGQPVRVWRRRANSISTSKTSPETHTLQVQLLEKCLDHMRAADLPPRFYKRELFNCVARIIWDMDIIPILASTDQAPYPELGRRIQYLLGDDSFGHQIFEDPMVSLTSRVGLPSRRGKISRTTFFALHKALRDGDFAEAHTLMQQVQEDSSDPLPAPVRHQGRTLILHLGMHKTGSTFIQHHLLHHRKALLGTGILVPQTGFELASPGATRDGAISGHQGLLRALRKNDDAVFDALHAEISGTTAKTVLISAENMLFPTAEDRDTLIQRLLRRLGQFDSTEVIALVRRPDTYLERFHAEWVTAGHPAGSQSLPEFLVQHQAGLLDLEALFAPFEAATGAQVVLGDFDLLRVQGAVWRGFCHLAGLPPLQTIEAPRYPTPSREAVQACLLVNRMMRSSDRRRAVLRTLIATAPDSTRHSLMSPAQRVQILNSFRETSGLFAALRGYAPDWDGQKMRIERAEWQPWSGLSADMHAAVIDAVAQCETPMMEKHAAAPLQPAIVAATAKANEKAPRPQEAEGLTIRIRPKPWVRKLIARIARSRLIARR